MSVRFDLEKLKSSGNSAPPLNHPNKARNCRVLLWMTQTGGGGWWQKPGVTVCTQQSRVILTITADRYSSPWGISSFCLKMNEAGDTKRPVTKNKLNVIKNKSEHFTNWPKKKISTNWHTTVTVFLKVYLTLLIVVYLPRDTSRRGRREQKGFGKFIYDENMSIIKWELCVEKSNTSFSMGWQAGAKRCASFRAAVTLKVPWKGQLWIS